MYDWTVDEFPASGWVVQENIHEARHYASKDCIRRARAWYKPAVNRAHRRKVNEMLSTGSRVRNWRRPFTWWDII